MVELLGAEVRYNIIISFYIINHELIIKNKV